MKERKGAENVGVGAFLRVVRQAEAFEALKEEEGLLRAGLPSLTGEPQDPDTMRWIAAGMEYMQTGGGLAKDLIDILIEKRRERLLHAKSPHVRGFVDSRPDDFMTADLDMSD